MVSSLAAYSTHPDHRFHADADRQFHAKPITLTVLVVAISLASAWSSNS